MGIEQILLPILGGIAQGAGKGIEEKARLRRETEAARDRQTAKYGMENPEFFETPEGRNFGIRHFGKEEFRGLRSALNLQTAQRKWRERQNEMGIINPAEMPADFAPTLAPLPESPQMNPGGIAGLISRFIPGAGMAMNALGGGQGGSPAQGMQMAQSSTGPPSGPQGYGAPAPTGGWQPAQTPNIQPQVAPQAAPAVVPVGAPPPGSDQSILKAAFDRGLDARLVSQVRTTPSGTRVIQTGGGGPLTKEEREAKYPRVTRLSDNMTLNIGKNGVKTFSYKNPDKNLNTPFDMAEHIEQLAGRGDRNNPDDLLRIMKLKSDIELTEEADKITTRTRATAFAEGSPEVIAAKQRLAEALQTTQEVVKLTAEGSPLGLKVKGDVAAATSGGNVIGTALGGNTPLPGLGGLTPNQQEAHQAGALAREKEAATVVDTVTQKSIEGKLGMLAMVDRIWQNYNPKSLGVIQGTSKALKWREITGLASGPESVMRQTMKALSNIKIQDLTGAGVTTLDAERILAELPSPQDSPDVFVAKLTNFQNLLAEAIDRQKTGATQPRGDLTPTGKTTTSPRVQVPVATTNAPINPKTGKQYNNQLPNMPTPAPVDNTATSAPAAPKGMWEVRGDGKDGVISDSSFGPDGKLLPEILQQLIELKKSGQVSGNVKWRRVPDDQYGSEIEKLRQ